MILSIWTYGFWRIHDLAVPQGGKSYRLPGPGVMNAETEACGLGGSTIPRRGRSHIRCWEVRGSLQAVGRTERAQTRPP